MVFSCAFLTLSLLFAKTALEGVGLKAVKCWVGYLAPVRQKVLRRELNLTSSLNLLPRAN